MPELRQADASAEQSGTRLADNAENAARISDLQRQLKENASQRTEITGYINQLSIQLHRWQLRLKELNERKAKLDAELAQLTGAAALRLSRSDRLGRQVRSSAVRHLRRRVGRAFECILLHKLTASFPARASQAARDANDRCTHMSPDARLKEFAQLSLRATGRDHAPLGGSCPNRSRDRQLDEAATRAADGSPAARLRRSRRNARRRRSRRKSKSAAHAHQHGEHRWWQGFHFTELLREMSILRRIISVRIPLPFRRGASRLAAGGTARDAKRWFTRSSTESSLNPRSSSLTKPRRSGCISAPCSSRPPALIVVIKPDTL